MNFSFRFDSNDRFQENQPFTVNQCLSLPGVRRDKAALFQWVKVPPG
jgi:hypothetical protein